LQREQAVGAVYGQAEQIGIERLREEIVGAESDRPQGVRLVVLAREDDHLDVGGDTEKLLQQAKTFRDRIGVGRKAEVHRHHGGGVPTALRERALAIVRDDAFKLVQRPLDLLLQGEVVLDDEQRRCLVDHFALAIFKADAW